MVLQAVPWVPPMDEPIESQGSQPLASAEQRKPKDLQHEAEEARFPIKRQAHHPASAVMSRFTLTCGACLVSMLRAVSAPARHEWDPMHLLSTSWEG